MFHVLPILMLEDDPRDAELVERQLRRAGLHMRIRRVDTEADFRRILQEEQPRVIFADYSMPKFDGFRALEIAVAEAPDTPFIFVSGTIGEERAIESLKRGAVDYVLKTNLARLPSAVERALRETSMRVARRQAEHMLREIVESSQDWIWQLSAEGRFTFTSPAVHTLLGYRPDELLGVHYAELLYDSDPVITASLLPPAEAEQFSLSGVVARWKHRHGHVVWLERNAIVLRDAADRIIGYRGSDRDVTERHEQEERIRRLNRIHRMTSGVNSTIVRTHRRTDLLEQACHIAVREGGYLWAAVTMVEQESAVSRLICWSGAQPERTDQVAQRLTASSANSYGLAARVMLSGAPLICNDLENDAQLVHCRDPLLALGTRSLAVLPLTVSGSPIGTLVLGSNECDVFDETEAGMLKELAVNIAFALQYYDKEDAVQFLSFFDPITGLRRRTLFCEVLARNLESASQAGRPMTIIVFDVQRLSLVNDAFGRSIGDRLLAQIADRMKRTFDEESIAHFGGGTFAVAFKEQIDPSETVRLQDAIGKVTYSPFLVEGREIRPSIRLGVAYFPTDGSAADVLVQNAEAALHKARQNGEKHQFYALMDNVRAEDRLAFEARLTNALARSEYRLLYQPKISIKTGRVVGVEALLRWSDPQGGTVPPHRFIPLLESTGEIVEVGQWVLEQAARDCRNWASMGLNAMRIAVNVSAVQLKRREFVEKAIAVVAGWSTDQTGLDLEITESMLLHDLESSASKLRRLREAGFRIAIDDFGTGYSSLGHLAKLPVDALKIDRSFTQSVSTDPDALTIVSTIISLAHSFDMSCVAEGVETAEQLNVLRLMKCDDVQGYLFSPPISADDIPSFVLRHHAASTGE